LLAPTGLVYTASQFWEALSQSRLFRMLKAMDVLTNDELARLTPAERLALISQLWDSLEADQLPLSAAQQAELDRRLETFEQDRREGITWEALKAELEQRCP
jgi:putative addiction module component (TIGR02574 family)